MIHANRRVFIRFSFKAIQYAQAALQLARIRPGVNGKSELLFGFVCYNLFDYDLKNGFIIGDSKT